MLEIYSKKNQEKKAVLSKNRIHTFILGHNEIYPENYKSDVKNSVPVAAVTIDVA